MKHERVSMLIKKTSLIVEKKTNVVLAPYELTNTQFRTLLFLYHKRDKQIRQIDIETAFAMTNPTVTGILNNLEKKGLVQRLENLDDRRSKLIALTDHALEMIPLLDSLGETIEGLVTSVLSDEEKAELAMLLKKIMKHAGEQHILKTQANYS